MDATKSRGGVKRATLRNQLTELQYFMTYWGFTASAWDFINFKTEALSGVAAGNNSIMGIRLMICDDHPAIRAGLVALLEGSDIGVALQAETCDEAVRLAEKGKPDVILLDIRLGEEDGLNALRKIKRNHPSIPVLIFSIADDLNDMAHAHKLGAEGYIVKSIRQEELLEIIRRAVARKKTWSISQIRKIKSRAAPRLAETRKPFL